VSFAPVIHALVANRGATSYSQLDDDGDDESAPQQVRVARAALRADGPVCADGYRPICDALWAAATMVGPPVRSDMRLVLSAARRLDGPISSWSGCAAQSTRWGRQPAQRAGPRRTS
jgi:hypothetical protein